VDADPRSQGRADLGAELAQAGLIREGEADGLDGPLEQQQEAVALVDLAALEEGQQVPRDAVVARQQLGCGDIADALDEAGARDEVAQQQRADRRARAAGGRGGVCGAQARSSASALRRTSASPAVKVASTRSIEPP
jgi:hypothetical protein